MSHVRRASTPLLVDEGPGEVPPPLDVTGMDASALYEAAQKYLFPSAWEKHKPESSAALINALIERGIDENNAALGLLLDNLRELLIVLPPVNRKRLREAIAIEQDAIKDDGEEGRQAAARLESAQLTMQLYDAKPAEQSALVLSYGIDTELDSWRPFCRDITRRDIASTDLESAPVGHVANWLGYVSERLSKEQISKLSFLPQLIIHPDQDVRDKALILATHGCNLPALKVFAASSFSESPDGEDTPDHQHEYWRNRALLEFCGFSPDASMSNRLSPEYIALIADHRPADPTALGQFNEYLRGEFEAIRKEKSWSRPRYWCSYRKVVSALVEYDLNAVLQWLEPWLEDPGTRVERAVMNRFPVIVSMQALSTKAPETALKLYKILVDPSHKGIFSTDGILNFPFEVPESQYADDLCGKLLEDAKTDKSLLDIACSAYRNNRLDWLFDHIYCLERSRSPADVAKAYTLLGFCDECGRADAAWQIFLAKPPSDCWLDGVIKLSANDYARNRAARMALTDFWATEEMGAARHALKRVEQMCDLRMGIWFEDICADWDDRPYQRRVAVGLATAGFNQAAKKDGESRKKELFHTRIAYSTMAPWK